MSYQSPSIIGEVATIGRGLVTGAVDYRGRSTRTEFWVGLLLVQWLGALFVDSSALLGIEALANAVITIATIVLLIPLFARRAHDTGMSAWWLLVAFGAIPLSLIIGHFDIAMPGAHFGNTSMFIDISNLGYIGTLFVLASLLWLGFGPGQDGDNRFGPNPRSAGQFRASA
jgi:uncharacterized membrane protein YhaH (DUF805 family)